MEMIADYKPIPEDLQAAIEGVLAEVRVEAQNTLLVMVPTHIIDTLEEQYKLLMTEPLQDYQIETLEMIRLIDPTLEIEDQQLAELYHQWSELQFASWLTPYRVNITAFVKWANTTPLEQHLEDIRDS